MSEKYYENQVFEDINLAGDHLEGYKFADCEFYRCQLNECVLTKCRFDNCRFTGCSVANIKTQSTYILCAEFESCSFTGLNWSILVPAGRQFLEPVTRMQDCRLRYNTFTNMSFRKADFSGNTIVDSMFGDCQLAESDFTGCKLEHTEFFKCDLRKADFRGATGYQVDISTCQLKEAAFSFPEAMNLLQGLEVIIDT